MSMRSLRRTLTIPVIAAAVVLGTVTYLLVEHQIRTRLSSEFDATLAAKARTLRSLVELAEADPEEGEHHPGLEFEFEAEFMPEFGAYDEPEGEDEAEDVDAERDEEDALNAVADTDVAYFQLWENDRTAARSATLENQQLSRDNPEMDASMIRDVVLPDGRSGRMITERFRPWLDEDWGEEVAGRLANLHARYPGLEYPDMTLAVAVSRAGLDETLAFVRIVLAAGLLSLIIIIAILVSTLTARGLRPLARLNGELGRIDSNQLDARVNESGLPAEVAPLVGTVNALLARLELAFEKERLFSRNIAHELRTPIAELRSLGDVGARWPDDPQANAGFFQDIEEISNRMDLMVTNLLLMAREENGHGTIDESMDLVDALRSGYRRVGVAGGRGDVAVWFEGPENIRVKADRMYLETVACNLFSNAIHHGGDGNRIGVAVYTKNGQAGFTMENRANGLSKTDLPHLFDRFWRKDQARTAGRHVGLGLPLVRALSEASGWNVDVALTRDHRFRVHVSGIRVDSA